MEKNRKISFFIFLGLFAIDLLIPDPLPWLDELVLFALAAATGIPLLRKKQE